MIVETDNMVLFWQADSVFSNRYPAKFEMHGQKFKNSEAAFMYLKAELFRDEEIMARILKNQEPAAVKRLGRHVKGFVEEAWDDAREYAMTIAVSWKFHSNPEMMKILKDTGKKLIVEASPVDAIWGIGLAPNDPLALDQANWKGLNLLGKVLMNVRDKID